MLKSSSVFLIVLLFVISNFVQASENPRIDRILSERTFLHYSKEMRISMLEDLYKNLKSRYSLWDIKKERLGIDGDALFKDAIQSEKLIEDEVLLEFQAKQNLDFLDRAKLLIATFQDTHMGLQASNERPYIFDGIEIKKINGKFYVSGYSQKIMSHNDINSSNGNYSNLKLGDEIISIDSKSPQIFADSLAPYIDASSKGYQEEEAINAISYRNFKYPEKSYQDYELKNKAGKTYKLRLPWFYYNEDFRPDALTHFKVIGLKSMGSIKIKWDITKEKYLKDSSFMKGFNHKAAPNDLIEKKEWMHSERDNLSLRTGYFLKEGKAVGVIQLYTYFVKNVYLKSDDNKKSKDVIGVLRSFIKKLKDNKMPLIFDLRYNGGGYPHLAQQITSLLTRKGDKHFPTTWSHRVTYQMRQILEDWDKDDIDNIDEPFNMKSVEALHQAIENNSLYTFAYRQSEIIEADSEVDGYDQKVIILLTPNCVSACDIQAMLLQSAKRVTFLGTHTNGTGAGFLTPTDGPYETKWIDYLQVLSLRIPNNLFGAPFEGDLVIDETENSHYTRNSENIPVKADVQYEMTLEDLTNNSEGYFKKAFELIFPSELEEEEQAEVVDELS